MRACAPSWQHKQRPTYVRLADVLHIGGGMPRLRLQVPFASARMQGEFAGPPSCGGTGAAQLHAYAASAAIICHTDLLQC